MPYTGSISFNSFIQSISSYNNIITNKNIYTEQVLQEEDTLFAFQRISNSIPFVRDRQYILKMYPVGDSRIDWYIINKNNSLLVEYLNKSVHTLTYGAGSWEIKEEKLINRIYIDEEINLPASFLYKLRIRHVTAIFDDILRNINKRRNK